MANHTRAERIGHEIQAAVAEIFARGLMRDPRIGYITITGVKMSADFRIARVYYSMLGDEAQKLATAEGLEAAKNFIRKEVTSRVKLRYSPEVYFVFDGSVEEGDKIERLLREIRSKEGW
ncbi:MAG: 30S ribosome-binding factor RbfA [Proteobacteria bacterium]|nr:30S ribosome-binding factor RbfA [Cystobacterineae bacterium]MCL2314705.1 30S ribosome-binding factor RbfA [Pseudomonadota bacterium]